MEENLTREGADKLANVIRKFWLDRGKDIIIWVDKISEHKGAVYSVRSNLINGLPPKDL